jgi:copper chaperone CopZ
MSAKTIVSIPGMHCASCVKLIQEVSGEFAGVHAEVDLASKKVTVEYPDDFDIKKWILEIESLGEAYKII